MSLIIYSMNKSFGTGLVMSHTRIHADFEFLQISYKLLLLIGLLNISSIFFGIFSIIGIMGFLIIFGFQLFSIFNNKPFLPYKSFILLFDNI